MGKEALEKFKKLFGKTVDEAMKDKEDEQKAKDEAEEAKKKEDEKKAKDAEEEEKKKPSLDERMDKLEKAVGDLVASLKKDDSEDEVEEDEVVVADEEEEEESEDSEDEESNEGEDGPEEELEEKKKKPAGDVMSRAEILAPGIEKSKNIKKVALATAYKTADGKKIIDTLTGGKGLSKLSKEAEDAIFNAAAEMMKAKRVKDFASERVTTIDSFPQLKGAGAKTAEEINKQNAAFYGKK